MGDATYPRALQRDDVRAHSDDIHVPSSGLTSDDLHRSVRGLDFVLAEAGKRGLRVILVLADNWYKTNGIDNYVQWGGSNKHQVC